jgi:hypothetical protein
MVLVFWTVKNSVVTPPKGNGFSEKKTEDCAFNRVLKHTDIFIVVLKTLLILQTSFYNRKSNRKIYSTLD